MKTLQSLIRRYHSYNKQMDLIKNKHQKLKAQMDELKNQMRELESLKQQDRNLIWWCVEHDESPVEAVLKHGTQHINDQHVFAEPAYTITVPNHGHALSTSTLLQSAFSHVSTTTGNEKDHIP
jgi:chromosome segregation ATPase